MSKKKPTPSKKKPGKVNGPYLAMAVVCENVLEDKDGVMSLIRVVDTFTLHAQTLSGEPIPPAVMAYLPGSIAFQIVVSFKAGRARGRRTLKIIPKTPSGDIISETALPVSFEGEDEARGVMVRVTTTMSVKQEGVYWIDILLDEEFTTRLPIKVVFETVERRTATKTQSS